jgi:hypothetical protein
MSTEPLLGWSFALIVGGAVYIMFEPHKFYWGVVAMILGGGLIYVRLRFFDKGDAA